MFREIILRVDMEFEIEDILYDFYNVYFLEVGFFTKKIYFKCKMEKC